VALIFMSKKKELQIGKEPMGGDIVGSFTQCKQGGDSNEKRRGGGRDRRPFRGASTQEYPSRFPDRGKAGEDHILGDDSRFDRGK